MVNYLLKLFEYYTNYCKFVLLIALRRVINVTCILLMNGFVFELNKKLYVFKTSKSIGLH